MDDQIVAIYCLCDDVLKALDHAEDPQRQMSDAEVMTTAVVAALHFSGNWERARELLSQGSYIPRMLGKSRFNRRLHAIRERFLTVFQVLGELFKQLNTAAVYVIDSFPIAICDHIRIPRARLYQEEAYRGYIASKRRYFYGLRIHLRVTADGEPVEVFLAPGADADVRALSCFPFDLPTGSIVYADSAFTHYAVEDLMEEAGIFLQPIRKKNSKRPVPPYVAYLQARGRKIGETTGSLIERLLPKSIHAVTSEGFELKVMLFVLAVSASYAV
ncbi:MAG TPA: IS982 family transposase [Geobacteraceae bacterium]|nr:IS982 family transposase [Geobacteraceae bacterium]